jgi:hypothetical protein
MVFRMTFSEGGLSPNSGVPDKNSIKISKVHLKLALSMNPVKNFDRCLL